MASSFNETSTDTKTKRDYESTMVGVDGEKLAVEEMNGRERQIEEHGIQKFNRLGWKRLTIVLVAEAVALGTLSIPSTFATLGMVGGVITCIGIGFIAIYTSYIVGRVKVLNPHITNFPDAAQLLFSKFGCGRFGYELVTVMLGLLLVFLGASHCLTGTIAFETITESNTCSIVFAVVSAIILFLLAIPPSFTEVAILGYVDFASILIAVAITIIGTGVEATKSPGLSNVNWSAWPKENITFSEAFIAGTNIAFAYTITLCQISFMDEMHTPSDYMKSIWSLGFIEIIVYTLTGALVYAFVGQDVKSPALLSAGHFLSRLVFGIALPVIFISGSINIVVFGRMVHGRIFKNSYIRFINTPVGWITWLSIILVTVIVAFIIAEVIPFFSDLLSLMSALFISGFTFYFPAMMWFFLLREGPITTPRNIALAILNGIIFLLGLLILVAGTYTSVQDIVNPMSDSPVKKACDACRRRKVKCISPHPCKQCQSAGLVCRTSIQRQRKGRQGQTANILTELRSKENEQVPTRETNISSPFAVPRLESLTTPQSPQVSERCQFSRAPGLLSHGLIDACSEYFFSRMRGTVPILQPNEFRKHIDLAGKCLHAYCLVTALCAFVVTQTGFAVDYDASDHFVNFSLEEFRASLIAEATEARKHIDPVTDPVRQSIIIAFLLYGCHIGLGNQRHAYYFLREATTLYTASALDDQPSSRQADDDPFEEGKLFWLLVISERAHAIRRHRPITLQVTTESPRLEDDPDSPTSNAGFLCLVDLYRPFDETFLAQWNGTNATCSIESLVQLQERIQNAVPVDLDLPDILMADLRVSQQWLRIMIWQLSTTAGFLSTSPAHACMDFRHPLQIAEDLCLATWKLSKQSMETHGIGLIEKLFEVACTLVDVMACLSVAGLRSSGFKLGPQDYLKHLCTLIHDLPGGRRRYLPLLLTKIRQTLPSMMEPITIHLNLQPYPVATSSIAGRETLSPVVSDRISLRGSLPESTSADIHPGSAPGNWINGNFNYAEMSRIGDKTPEIDEAFLQYTSYFP
ncbi:unnamed protein product [Penicillium olsonii]|uniref:Zn(2)-C6 fungal-type domain-containing protein n=1 Tax=Penicillium olsonii TaxID=99116 RepID=A0A9W4HA02_PENOL|nr:unnamed protein product [Penicillium olsonii]CAG8262228.1 unnamed protein product [Penicillium olsonii]